MKIINNSYGKLDLLNKHKLIKIIVYLCIDYAEIFREYLLSFNVIKHIAFVKIRLYF